MDEFPLQISKLKHQYKTETVTQLMSLEKILRLDTGYILRNSFSDKILAKKVTVML